MASYQQQDAAQGEWPQPAMPEERKEAEEAAAVLQPAESVRDWRGPSARRLLQIGALVCAALLLLAFIATRTATDDADAAVVTMHPAQVVDAAQHAHSKSSHGHESKSSHGHSSKSKSSHEKSSRSSKGKAKVQHSRTSAAAESQPQLQQPQHQQLSDDQPESAPVNGSIINSAAQCGGPYPGYPYCQDHVDWMTKNWNASPENEAYYRSHGVDGTICSFLNYLNLNGFYCPEAQDFSRRKIRGVNLGGWLVLEPWIKPSLFEQFDTEKMVSDQWMFCEALGRKECRRQLEKHWDSWLLESDLEFLADAGINHVRIPVGYWLFGDIRAGEPWVDGELPYLERAIRWCQKHKLHVVLDLHCAPGSQNGFDNSGRKGDVHFADAEVGKNGRTVYPNIQRALQFIANLTAHFSQDEFKGTVVGIELVNEAFITIPIEVVKDYYLQGYEIVKQNGDTMAVIIGDSFRFGAWNDFMFPPHYRHVWIDTHIYQLFDVARLQMTWAQHTQQTCKLNKPEVAVAPLSTMVGEWCLATTDCAKWLNGYNVGSRFDGTFPTKGAGPVLGSCIGQENIHNKTIWTPEYRAFLTEYAQKQMDAYESGSSSGWFFWNFKTEKGAPQWDYMLGVREGWIPKDLDNRKIKC